MISTPVPILEAFAVKKELGIREKLFKINITKPKVKQAIPMVKKKSIGVLVK